TVCNKMSHSMNLRFEISDLRSLLLTGGLRDLAVLVNHHAEAEAHRGQDVLDFVQRLAAEILGLEHFGFGLLDEVADRLDIRVLQTVVGADREFKLVNRLVEIFVDRRGLTLRGDFDRLVHVLLKVDEDGHVILDQLGREADRVFRRHAAVGPDFERELVVVGVLTEARGLDVEVDLLDRRVGRVNRDVTDRQVVVEVAVGRDVAAPLLDAHLDADRTALADRGDVNVRIKHLDVRVNLDVTGLQLTRFGAVHAERLRLVRVHLERDLLEVEDNVSRVLDDAGDRGE